MSRRKNKQRSRKAKQNYKRSALAQINARRRADATRPGKKKRGRKLNKKQRNAILLKNLNKANAARRRNRRRRRRR